MGAFRTIKRLASAFFSDVGLAISCLVTIPAIVALNTGVGLQILWLELIGFGLFIPFSVWAAILVGGPVIVLLLLIPLALLCGLRVLVLDEEDTFRWRRGIDSSPGAAGKDAGQEGPRADPGGIPGIGPPSQEP